MALPAGYDRIVQQLTPGYASLARLSVSLIAASSAASARGAAVLVVGCGTGAELDVARASRPDWALTAVDPDPTMLAAARQRIGADSVRWVEGKLGALARDDRFDGALAVLVMQGLPDDGAKLRFLSEIARHLKPSGQLVLVDLMAPLHPSLQRQIDAAWGEYQRSAGLQAEADPTLLRSLTADMHRISPARLAGLANAAGFSDPARIFNALDYEGYLLQKRSVDAAPEA
ncbi:MAG: class I SAM-dependent methyltransferase [Aphanocapsa feldmannii 288cV]|nr:MAG: class I SAM-dependent methyltransferase [Aphanocapsa feldmannii 288cV]